MSDFHNTKHLVWRTTALTLTCLCIFYVSVVQTNGVDFWLLARIGEITVSGHAIPDTVLFPFTEVAEQHFNAHEWLSSIIFHFLLKLFGEAGLPFFTGFLGLAYFAVAARLALCRGNGNFSLALVGGIVAVAGENYRHVPRPELLTLLLMAVYWRALEQFRRRSSIKRALQASVLTIIWANCHGSFILAPVLAGLYALGSYIDTWIDFRRHGGLGLCRPQSLSIQLGLFSLAMLASSLINPFGLDLILFVLSFGGSAELQHLIVEWMPTFSPAFLKAPGVWIAVGITITTVAVMVADYKRTEAAEWLVLFFFLYLACKAIRFPVYIGLVAAWIIPNHISLRWQDVASQKRLYQICSVFVVFVFGLALRYGNAHGHFPYTPGVSKLSDEMVKTLSNPSYSGNVYTSLELGSELVYRAYPRLRPSIDCRIDSYGIDYLQYHKALLTNNALMAEFLQRYDVRYILVDQAKFKLLQSLEVLQHENWQLVFMDKNAVFLQRAL